MIREVKARIEKNPCQSARKMAAELGISRERVQHILKNELKVKAYKLQESNETTPQQKKVRVEKAK